MAEPAGRSRDECADGYGGLSSGCTEYAGSRLEIAPKDRKHGRFDARSAKPGALYRRGGGGSCACPGFASACRAVLDARLFRYVARQLAGTYGPGPGEAPSESRTG